jgi:hypothetical protein
MPGGMPLSEASNQRAPLYRRSHALPMSLYSYIFLRIEAAKDETFGSAPRPFLWNDLLFNLFFLFNLPM